MFKLANEWNKNNNSFARENGTDATDGAGDPNEEDFFFSLDAGGFESIFKVCEDAHTDPSKIMHI